MGGSRRPRHRRFTPGARIRALEEAIIVVRALACGGEPVTFDGEFYYKVTKLMPAAAPTPLVWVGVGGPKGLAVTGRNADGWIPPHAADGLTRVPKLGVVAPGVAAVRVQHQAVGRSAGRHRGRPCLDRAQ